MFARFDENPAMTLEDIKETKRHGRTDGRTHAHTDARTHGQRENSIPTTTKFAGVKQIAPSKAVVGVDRPMKAPSMHIYKSPIREKLS